MTLPETIPLVGIAWNDLLFLILGAVLLGAGLLVVTMRDIIRCGLAMIVCFAALAGIYVMAGAPLVAAAQVLVYIGAISVLVLFAIMLTQTKAGPSELVFHSQARAAGVAAVILGIVLAIAVTATAWPEGAGIAATRTSDLARTLFGKFVLPFEIVSVLLLAAVVGGVFLAKREGAEGPD
jgi:NADH-quinone oxidoreductase subunit J